MIIPLVSQFFCYPVVGLVGFGFFSFCFCFYFCLVSLRTSSEIESEAWSLESEPTVVTLRPCGCGGKVPGREAFSHLVMKSQVFVVDLNP